MAGAKGSLYPWRARMACIRGERGWPVSVASEGGLYPWQARVACIRGKRWWPVSVASEGSLALLLGRVSDSDLEPKDRERGAWSSCQVPVVILLERVLRWWWRSLA